MTTPNILPLNQPVPVNFTKVEAIGAAWALKASAAEAYCDERLTTAATHYSLAARLFFAAGYSSKAALCRQLATAIDQEAIAIASGADDEAEYAANTVAELVQDQLPLPGLEG